MYTTPEQIWSRELVTSAYKKDPQESAKRILEYIREQYPVAEEKQIQKVLIGRK